MIYPVDSVIFLSNNVDLFFEFFEQKLNSLLFEHHQTKFFKKSLLCFYEVTALKTSQLKLLKISSSFLIEIFAASTDFEIPANFLKSRKFDAEKKIMAYLCWTNSNKFNYLIAAKHWPSKIAKLSCRENFFKNLITFLTSHHYGVCQNWCLQQHQE